MKSVFADADYWIALLHSREELHQKAAQVSASLGPVRIVSSEMVLAEVLNALGSRGESIRAKAAECIEQLRHATQQSVNAAIKSICDIMRRSNCAGAMKYVPELTWILFLRILDERETQEADAALARLRALTQ